MFQSKLLGGHQKISLNALIAQNAEKLNTHERKDLVKSGLVLE